MKTFDMANRRCAPAHGFTLIELLIVIAIVAIMSAATISYLTMPPMENAIAETELNFERGAATFFAQAVFDAHGSVRLAPSENRKSLVFEKLGSGGNSVIYFIDASKRLRRMEIEGAAGANIAGNMESLTAERERQSPVLMESAESLDAEPDSASGLWRICLTGASKSYDRNIAMEKSALISLGHAWVEAQR
ncbi:MAG: type II secretion system protein [Candidatus Sumerlaeota bacterium]|nr:type II secretion system protein [Candidatus Sumerlaeota bacterium]